MLYNQGRFLSSEYHPERARKLLGERKINLGRLIFIKYSNDLAQIARRIELDLSKIGIEITCQPLTRQEYQKSINEGNYALALQILPSSAENAIRLSSFIPLFRLNTNILLRTNIHGLPDASPNDVLQLDSVFFLI